MLELVKPLSIKKVFLVSNSVNFKSHPGVAMSLRKSVHMYLQIRIRKSRKILEMLCFLRAPKPSVTSNQSEKKI